VGRRQSMKRAAQINLRRAQQGFPPISNLKLKHNGTVVPREKTKPIFLTTPYRFNTAFKEEFEKVPVVQKKTICRLSQLWKSIKELFHQYQCDVCGGPWNPKEDGIIGDGRPKVGFENFSGAAIEKTWIEMGYKGCKVCSECFCPLKSYGE